MLHTITPDSTTSYPSSGSLAFLTSGWLLLGLSPALSGLDIQCFDDFTFPGSPSHLRVGDTIVAYRHVDTLLTPALAVPRLAVTLSKVVSYGSNHIEFRLHSTNSGHHLPKTVKLPLCVVCLSRAQRIRRALFLYPRSSSSPPRSPLKDLRDNTSPQLARHIGDRVARDSDDLPIWDKRRQVTFDHVSCFSFLLTKHFRSDALWSSQEP